MSTPRYTVPGISLNDAGEVIDQLRMRLHALNDLALTLKHVHWNVVGPHFIAVHTMIDPQVEAVRAMVDETAERIATLGGSPDGTPGTLVSERTWDNYKLGRADALEHLVALDHVYTGIIIDHRKAAAATEESDPVTQDMLIAQLHALEQFHWFIRAHHETAGGALTEAPAKTAAPRSQTKGRKKS
ncbi:Dps family protein [Streptacidiphilus sp. N1-12]|uniref:Dps family protein n=2 Tax=Streptacidiphilus alkalitolerans TaxID=3342712 RepID=A0ABV6VIT4_9ACTN